MIYLKQHSQAVRCEHKFDFRPPKEKERDKSDHKGKDSSSTKESHPRKRKGESDHKSSKAKGIKMTDKSSPNPKRINSSDQCKRRDCRRRGTHTNHTHDECKFKESESAKHPNVGKAAPKKQRNAKTNASQPTKNAHTPSAKTNERKCYT
jgi:hypothetical protein